MWDQVLSFVRSYGNVLSLAAIIAAFTYFVTVVEKAQAKQISLMEERLRNMEPYSVEKVQDKFEALKKFYDSNMKDWYQSEVQKLEVERDTALEKKENEFAHQLEMEIRDRASTQEKYESLVAELDARVPLSLRRLPLRALAGSFRVTGGIDGEPASSYSGTLEIESRQQTAAVVWSLGATRYLGTGFIVCNHFIVFFERQTPPGAQEWRPGVVAYDFLSDRHLRGRWIAAGGDPIGWEELTR
jgi:hypothetical protein